MPIFVYRCASDHRFEMLVPRDADAPRCPECGSETRKLPAGPSLGSVSGGRAAADNSARDAARRNVPIPWRGVVAGGPEKLQREVEFRQRLEARALGGLRVPGGPDHHPEKGSGGESSGGQSKGKTTSD